MDKGRAEEAEKLGHKLAFLASEAKGGRQYYHVLSNLYNEAYAAEKDPAQKALAGLARVERFERKIQDWVKEPLSQLQAANERKDDASASKARVAIRKKEGLPKFDQLEQRLVREEYASKEEREVLQAKDATTMSRRKWLGVAAGMGVVAAGGVYLESQNQTPEITPEQATENKARKSAMAATNMKNHVLESAEELPDMLRNRVSQALEEEAQALAKLAKAEQARKKSGQVSYDEAVESQKERAGTAALITGMGAGAASSIALIQFLNMGSDFFSQHGEDKKKEYDVAQETLRQHLFNVVERFGNGMKPLMEAVAREREKERGA